MTPEELAARSWAVRMADAMYGPITSQNIGGWEPGAARAWMPNENAVGYYRFNTGNPTRDAIFSIAANELGLDNALRATQAREDGRWGEWLKQMAFAVGEASTFGLTGGAATALARSLGRPGVAGRIGTGIGTRLRSQGPQGFATSVGRGLQGAWQELGRTGTRLGAVLGTVAIGGYGAQGFSDPAKSAAEIERERASLTEDPPETPRTIRDVTPVGDPVADAGNAARGDVAGINRQYDNILRELQGMYQLSETEEERERLRFMLADIEAQRDAGLQAISEGYAQTVAAIQQRGEVSRQQTTERAERFGGQLEGYADRAAQRMMLQNVNQQQQFRGLGSGSTTPVNEWVGLMSAMAPLQQQYMQRMGDITAEGIDWIGDTTSAQGQAQQADLQRLAAATRSASIMSHQRQVDDRIQREREQQRAAILQTMQMQANAVGSGTGLDPFDRLRAIEAWAMEGLGPGYIEQSFRDTGQSSLTPGELARIEILNQRYLGKIPPDAATTPLDPDGN